MIEERKAFRKRISKFWIQLVLVLSFILIGNVLGIFVSGFKFAFGILIFINFVLACVLYLYMQIFLKRLKFLALKFFLFSATPYILYLGVFLFGFNEKIIIVQANLELVWRKSEFEQAILSLQEIKSPDGKKEWLCLSGDQTCRFIYSKVPLDTKNDYPLYWAKNDYGRLRSLGNDFYLFLEFN